MDEQLKKNYISVIEFIINNFKNYIAGNFSIRRNVLFGDIRFKFPELNIEYIKSLVDKICLKIEIDSIASGIKIKDMKIILEY